MFCSRISIGFRLVLTLFMLFLVIFSMESLKNARITIRHVYFSALLTLAMSLGSSLNPWPGGLRFKQLPRATANVNARENLHDPYI